MPVLWSRFFALAHEHDPDPAMRPYKEPISAEMRERLIVGVAAGVMKIYKYFEAQIVGSGTAKRRHHLAPHRTKDRAQ
jgi:hypothetical protein